MLSVESSTGRDGARDRVTVHRDVRIPTGEPGVTLAADVWIPAEGAEHPALITALPYRKDIAGIGLEPLFTAFALRGYACVLVDLGGYGASDGRTRPKMDPGEGDDAVAAIEWVAAQQWCDGSVGMWGASSGGVSTLRAASRRPAALKAILVIECPVDPGRDAFYHDGCRVDLHQRVAWSGSMLVQQLLPPLTCEPDPQAEQRWRQRLAELEPFLLDFARRGPDDPALHARRIDIESINVPTLCVAGWRDLYADAMVRLYERLNVPKKLLVGPWFHRTPLESADGIEIALPWWDYWLRGTPTLSRQEHGAAVYVQGPGSGWRNFTGWPKADYQRLLVGSPDRRLAEPGRAVGLCTAESAGSVYQPDPTTGALSGLWGIPVSGGGEPLDQRDDDRRALSWTSSELTHPILICGRPSVELRVSAQTGTALGSTRVVLRLADVDEDGRSTFITAGVSRVALGTWVSVQLRPTAYRIPPGHRLRLVFSDADFPRLTPLANPVPLVVHGISLSIPSLADDAGDPFDLLGNDHSAAPGTGLSWTITRDAVHDGIEVSLGQTATIATPTASLEVSSALHAAVRKSAPALALAEGTHATSVHTCDGKTAIASAWTRCTLDSASVRCELTIDDAVVWTKEWNVPLAHEGEDTP